MNENNNASRYYDDDEIEIDLLELWHELKNSASLIAGVTAAFIAAAAIYVFAIAKPVYGYTAFVRVPPINGAQMNSFVEMCKADVKNDKLWGENPVGKLSAAEMPRGSALIKLDFEGKSEADVAKVGKEYTNKVLTRINDVIVKQEEQKFSREVVSMIRRDVEDISSKLSESSFNTKDAAERINKLVQRLETKEKNKMFLKAELAQEPIAPEKTIKPQKAKTVAIALVAGLFLSCGYVVARYIFRKSYSNVAG